MTISHTATQLVSNPPPMLERVFAEHRAQFGVRDLEREVDGLLDTLVSKALDHDAGLIFTKAGGVFETHWGDHTYNWEE